MTEFLGGLLESLDRTHSLVLANVFALGFSALALITAGSGTFLALLGQGRIVDDALLVYLGLPLVVAPLVQGTVIVFGYLARWASADTRDLGELVPGAPAIRRNFSLVLLLVVVLLYLVFLDIERMVFLGNFPWYAPAFLAALTVVATYVSGPLTFHVALPRAAGRTRQLPRLSGLYWGLSVSFFAAFTLLAQPLLQMAGQWPYYLLAEMAGLVHLAFQTAFLLIADWWGWMFEQTKKRSEAE